MTTRRQPHDIRLDVRVNEDTWRRLMAIARKLDLPLNTVARLLLVQKIEQAERSVPALDED